LLLLLHLAGLVDQILLLDQYLLPLALEARLGLQDWVQHYPVHPVVLVVLLVHPDLVVLHFLVHLLVQLVLKYPVLLQVLVGLNYQLHL
jgi:hypothetical protein